MRHKYHIGDVVEVDGTKLRIEEVIIREMSEVSYLVKDKRGFTSEIEAEKIGG